MAGLLNARSARSRDCRDITVVGVDAGELGDALGLDVLDDDVARAAIVAAVAAAAVELAGIDDGVVLDRDRTAPVVLDYLVDCVLRAAALDENVAFAKEGDSV